MDIKQHTKGDYNFFTSFRPLYRLLPEFKWICDSNTKYTLKMHKNIAIQQIEGKNRGVVALGDIPKETIIMHETPIIDTGDSDYSTTAELFDSFKKFIMENDRLKKLELDNGDSKTIFPTKIGDLMGDDFSEKYKKNTFQLDGTGYASSQLFLGITMFNTVFKAEVDGNYQRFKTELEAERYGNRVYLLKDVKAGQEIRIHYNSFHNVKPTQVE